MTLFFLYWDYFNFFFFCLSINLNILLFLFSNLPISNTLITIYRNSLYVFFLFGIQTEWKPIIFTQSCHKFRYWYTINSVNLNCRFYEKNMCGPNTAWIWNFKTKKYDFKNSLHYSRKVMRKTKRRKKFWCTRCMLKSFQNFQDKLKE